MTEKPVLTPNQAARIQKALLHANPDITRYKLSPEANRYDNSSLFLDFDGIGRKLGKLLRRCVDTYSEEEWKRVFEGIPYAGPGEGD